MWGPDGKGQTKVPYNLETLRKARANDPSTWRDFASAALAYKRTIRDPHSGAGFMFGKEPCGLVGIDLDVALDERGEPYPWAAKLLADLELVGGFYAEVSPSRRGLHLVARGKLPCSASSGGRVELGGATAMIGGKEKTSGVEVYERLRYFTVSGEAWRGHRDIAEDGQAIVDAVLDATGLRDKLARGAAAAAPSGAGVARDKFLEPRRLREALSWLDPNVSEPEWFDVINAVVASTPDKAAAREVLAEWSSGALARESRAVREQAGRLFDWEAERDGPPRWDDGAPAALADKVRRSDPNGGLGAGTLVKEARAAGWPDAGPTAAEEFAASRGEEHEDLLGPARQPAGQRLWATSGDALLRPAPALPSPGTSGPPYQIVRKGKDKGGVARTPENIALYFAQDARFTGTGLLRLNVRRGVELNGVLLTDVGYTALGAAVTKAHAWDTVPSAEHLYAGVQLAAAQRQYDPIREYLLAQEWDGTPRLDEWLVRAGAEDSPATRLVGRRWLIGAAGRGLHEPQPGTPPEFAPSVDRGTKMDYCLVLEGPQGLKKSSVLEALCPEPYFFDSSFSFDPGRVKDLYQALGENFIVEMAELHALGKSDVLAAKAVITSRTDKFRAPYARAPEAHPRRAALAGSANGREWQRDLTGGRRFWPAWCPGELDARWVRENRDQLWAELALRRGRGAPPDASQDGPGGPQGHASDSPDPSAAPEVASRACGARGSTDGASLRSAPASVRPQPSVHPIDRPLAGPILTQV